MRRVVLFPPLAALLVCFAPAALLAQDPYTGPPPAHVSVVDGRATLERDGQSDSAPLNAPVLAGDRLRTMDGRVEVVLADGSSLDLDGSTTLDVQSDDLVRLIDGRIRLNIVGPPSRGVTYRVDSPSGSVRIAQPGEYRVALLHGDEETQLELAVLRGSAEIFTDQGTTLLRAGERAYASAGLAPSYAYAFNSAAWDEFDEWSEARRSQQLGTSAQYLPSDVRSYAPVLEEYGDWRYADPYGYVWYPHVAAGWRPYYYGRWMSYPRFGWTWIGVESWAWPTHHYGRWGYSAGVWFWIPGRTWAPAYVSWAYAPGYVSWCPLGFDNRPLFAINVNFGSRYYSPWRGWTAVSSRQFGYGYVHQRAAVFDRGPNPTHPAFRIRPTAPAYPDVAVPRRTSLHASPAAAAPGVRERAVTPSAAPRYVNRGDQIIRSQTARPQPPVYGSGVAVPRGSVAQPLPQGNRAIQPPRTTMPARPGMPVGGEPAIERGRMAPSYPQPPTYGAPSMAAPGIPRGGDQRMTTRPFEAPRAYRPSAPRPSAGPGFDARPAPAPGYYRSAPAPDRAMPRSGPGPHAAPPRGEGRPAPPNARPSGGAASGQGAPAQAAPRRGGRGGR